MPGSLRATSAFRRGLLALLLGLAAVQLATAEHAGASSAAPARTLSKLSRMHHILSGSLSSRTLAPLLPALQGMQADSHFVHRLRGGRRTMHDEDESDEDESLSEDEVSEEESHDEEDDSVSDSTDSPSDVELDPLDHDDDEEEEEEPGLGDFLRELFFFFGSPPLSFSLSSPLSSLFLAFSSGSSSRVLLRPPSFSSTRARLLVTPLSSSSVRRFLSGEAERFFSSFVLAGDRERDECFLASLAGERERDESFLSTLAGDRERRGERGFPSFVLAGERERDEERFLSSLAGERERDERFFSAFAGELERSLRAGEADRLRAGERERDLRGGDFLRRSRPRSSRSLFLSLSLSSLLRRLSASLRSFSMRRSLASR
mmetsp:Transcript_95825/g.139989  ORF Transcript_95825/g.139989 Transcript_95825/m.139989 type:complete len:375 (-) Transcript_95825:515-1639(-)